MQTIHIESVEALGAAMPLVFDALQGRRKIALYGDMGAGKTTFSKAFCRYLGVTDNTASPTFSLINEYHYTGDDGRLQVVHHLDLYRLRSTEEAFDAGVEEVLYDPWYCLIEWPQLIEPLLPEDVAVIRIAVTEDGQRILQVNHKNRVNSSLKPE